MLTYDGNSLPQVNVANGLFTVELDFGAGAFSGDRRWLEITVDGVPLSPRQELTATPYARRAAYASGPWETFDSDIVYLYGKVGIGQPFPENSFSVLGNVDVIGNVGIGTPTPGNKLSIDGGVTVDRGGFNDGTLASAIRFGADFNSEGIASKRTGGGNQNGLDLYTNNTARLSITNAGNVGIGTTAPGNKLSVAGNADINGSVGIGTDAPSAPLDVRDSLRVTNADPDKYVEIKTTGSVTDIKSEGSALVLNYQGTQDVYACIEGGQVAIGTESPGGFKFVVNGSAAKPGGGSWSIFSDARLKRDFEPMKGTLDKVLSLHGYEFNYTDDAIVSRFGLPGRQIGLIAQEVEQVFPDWVGHDANGYRHVTERGTTALMVEALRDLRAEKDEQLARRDAEIADLNERIAALERLVGRLAPSQIGGGQ